MKKLILVSAAILFSIGSFAQADAAKRKMDHDKKANKSDNSMNHRTTDKSHPDGVMMQDGKMMMVKNGKMTMLDKDVTMDNGTKVMSNGTCVKKDGSKMMMKEGEHIDMSGKMNHMKDSKMKRDR